MIELAVMLLVHPMEIEEPLHNPGKGWVLIDSAVPGAVDAGRSVSKCADGTCFEWYPNVAVLSTWAFIESEPDVLDWSLMDRVVDYWAGQGKRIHLRFSTEDFGGYVGCPRWLFEMGVPYQTRMFGRAELRFPDYTHPVYIQRLKKFLGHLADHFADDERVETVNLQGYGNFGEWHSGYGYKTVEKRVRALRGIIDAWREAFGGRKLLNLSATYEWRAIDNVGEHFLPWGTSIYEEFPPSYQDYRYRSVFDYAYAFPDITISRHGVGGSVKFPYDGRLIANFFQMRRKPLFMEFFGGLANYRGPSIVGFPTTQEGDDHIINAVDEMLSHHATFATPMGWQGLTGAAEFYNDYRDLMLAGHKLMGYRFVIVRATFPREIAPGGVLRLEHSWENRALGRCRRPYRLAAYLLQGGDVKWAAIDRGFDPTYMVAGSTYDLVSEFTLPADLAAGRYELRVALVDDDDVPVINLAIEGGDGEKRYHLGTVEISPAAPRDSQSEWTSLDVQGDATRWECPAKLPADCNALVTFAYTVTRDPDRDLHSDDPGYFRFYVEGSDGSRAGEVRWFDKAGLPTAWKTVLVCTEGAAPYRLVWEAVGGGACDVAQVRIKHLAGDAVRRIDVRSNDVRLLDGAHFEQAIRVAAERDKSEVSLPDDWYPYLTTRPESVRLEPGAVYTVWFYAMARPQLWQGDYHYLYVRRPGDTGPPEHPMFRWTQRHTSNPVMRAYTFRAGPAPGSRLEWGIKNGGAARISHIVLVRR